MKNTIDFFKIDNGRLGAINLNNMIPKAVKLYNKYKENKLPDALKSRCCNFLLLEEKLKKYNK